MPDWMIRSEKLSKKYDKAAFFSVDALDIEIKKGTIFGILGPNGAGKTTTLSMLCGLMRPTSGKILFSDDINPQEIRKNIGFVPQELALYQKLTARENIMFFGSLYGLDKNIVIQRTDELLVLVGLEKRANENIERFSTGMKRRINLAAGLIHKPCIILLDEPTVGIDPQSRNCIYDAIFKLRDDGVTVLYTTHYMEEASRLCDTVAIMDRGRIISEGRPSELVKKQGNHRLYFGFEKYFDENILKVFYKINGVNGILVSGASLEFTVSNETDNLAAADSIMKIAEKNGIRMTLNRIEEPNLENLFLDLTGRTLRDEIET